MRGLSRASGGRLLGLCMKITGKQIRRAVYIVLILLILIAVIIRRREAINVVRTLLQCIPWLLALAVVAEVVFYLLQALVYRSIAKTVGLKYPFFELAPLILVLPFVNVAVPSTGVAALALLADDARQRDMEPEAAIVAGLIYNLFFVSSLSIFIWPGLWELRRYGVLRPYQAWAGAAYAGFVGIMLLILVLGGWAPHVLGWIINWASLLARALRRIVRWPERKSGNGLAISREVEHYQHIIKRATHNWQDLGLAILWALLAQGFNLLVLFLCVSSLGRSITPFRLVAGGGVSNLITMISPTPQGIGLTEGATADVFSSLGQPLETAVAITLVYRGVTFWLPLIASLILMRRLRTFRGGVERPTAEEEDVRG